MPVVQCYARKLGQSYFFKSAGNPSHTSTEQRADVTLAGLAHGAGQAFCDYRLETSKLDT